MNSRDAMYEEAVKAALEASAAEAAAQESTPHNGVKDDENSSHRSGEAELEGEATTGSRRKRKRTEDDA